MLSRVAVSAGLAAVVLVGAAVPALADGWGNVNCEQGRYAGCRLGAGSGGRYPGEEGGGSSSGSHRSGSGGGSGAAGGGHRAAKNPNPDLNLATCSYQRSDYTSPPGAVQTAYEGPTGSTAVVPAVYEAPTRALEAIPVDGPRPGRSGAWYVYKCTQDGVRDAVYRPPVWIPDAPKRPGQAALPSPAQLAQAAYNQLRLPSPAIEANPAGEQLVGLPTWLWMDRNQWAPVSSTASVPGVSVTAVARPTSVVWVLGDGTTLTCGGPGTRYAASGSPKRGSPDCGHTYRMSSAGRPDGAFAVSATVHWTVTWSGAGQGGVFPDMTTVSNAAFRVAESEALNNSR